MIRALAAVVAALACAGTAYGAGRAALPSPIAPLSAEPPLAGGAKASAENVTHSIASSTQVIIAIDNVGKPFAVTATQRLDVLGTGDYFFTIGAPVLTVTSTAESESVPGMRTGSIVWAGFDPDRRVLVARATLDPTKVVSALPIRIHAAGDTVVLENLTGVSVGTFDADAPQAPLLAYLARLRSDAARGRTPPETTVPLASEPAETRVTVAAPLHVVGTIGRTRINLLLHDRSLIHASGPIDLHVEPVEGVEDVAAVGGRGLLRAAIRATLTYARAHQYEEFLGNPDPAGASRTAYVYRTASPPHAAPIADVGHQRRAWFTPVLIVGVIAAALVAGAAMWSRS